MAKWVPHLFYYALQTKKPRGVPLSRVAHPAAFAQSSLWSLDGRRLLLLFEEIGRGGRSGWCLRVVRLLGLHAVVTVGVRAGRGGLEEIDDLRDGEALGRALRLEVAHDGHRELRHRQLLAARGVGDDRHVLHELLVVEEVEERLE